MLRILIFDRDMQFTLEISSQVRRALEELDQEAVIYRYSCTDEIPMQHLKFCDLFILEPFYSNSNGLTIARKIRYFGSNAVIILVSENTNLAHEGYEVNTFRFLLKSQIRNKLELVVKMAIIEILKERPRFKMMKSGEEVSIIIDEVVYIEAQSHTVVFHFVDNRHNGSKITTYNSKISFLEERLDRYGFLRIHRSYLVNMRHLTKLQCNKAIMANGLELSVSEKNYRKIREKFVMWKEYQ